MTMHGDDIKRLIPQREPILMVGEFESDEPNAAHTALKVADGNYFLLADGTMAATGLIEHIAQSAAALVGMQSAGDVPRIGLIGEVKHFECRRLPVKGERIETHIQFVFSMGNVTVAKAESSIDGDTIAHAQLKIFIQ